MIPLFSAEVVDPFLPGLAISAPSETDTNLYNFKRAHAAQRGHSTLERVVRKCTRGDGLNNAKVAALYSHELHGVKTMPYTDHITEHDLVRLLDQASGACVSIYLPTTPLPADMDKARIQLKNLRSEAFNELSQQGVRRPDAEAILLPVDELLDDESFWPYLSDGLAIYTCPSTHAVFRLPIAPEPSCRVSWRFILKPLIPLLTEDSVFYIMAISRNDLRLFEGTRHHIRELPSTELPSSMSEALKIRKRPSMSSSGKIQGDEGQKKLYLQYFLQIDRLLRPVYAVHSEPLVIAGVDYLLPIFREASSYPHLVPEGIVGSPEQLTAEELHAKALPLVEPIFTQPRREAIASYRALQGTGKTANDLEQVLTAALDGRVKTLFVNLEADRFGRFDTSTRKAVVRETPEAGDADLCAQAARLTYETGGQIFAGTPSELPEDRPLMAILRYA